jgi:hypothetical protein
MGVKLFFATITGLPAKADLPVICILGVASLLRIPGCRGHQQENTRRRRQRGLSRITSLRY